MKPFLIIKTGATFDELIPSMGDFEQWTANAMGLNSAEWACVNVQKGALLPDPNEFAGCVLTGSHDMVTDNTRWMRDATNWLRDNRDSVPMLGICFGHQLFAHAFGGTADAHPDGPEIGTVEIRLNEHAAADPLFKHLPRVFPAHVTHSQSALHLPPAAVALGASDHDQHQAFRFGQQMWGVQFHPEFNATATRQYVREQTDTIKHHGKDADAIYHSVGDTPEATSLLRHFVSYCRN